MGITSQIIAQQQAQTDATIVLVQILGLILIGCLFLRLKSFQSKK